MATKNEQIQKETPKKAGRPSLKNMSEPERRERFAVAAERLLARFQREAKAVRKLARDTSASEKQREAFRSAVMLATDEISDALHGVSKAVPVIPRD